MITLYQMADYLARAGWTRRRRRRGEPWFYVDPLKCVQGGLRCREAFGLQKRREHNGVVKAPE